MQGNGDTDWKAKWQNYAMKVGDEVYAAVNREEWQGTDKETGYILLFFNVKKHNGRTTMLAYPEIPLPELKQLLRTALDSVADVEVITPEATKET